MQSEIMTTPMTALFVSCGKSPGTAGVGLSLRVAIRAYW